MEDDSSRKDITDGITFGSHIFDVDDFRGNETWSATSNKQILLLICMGG